LIAVFCLVSRQLAQSILRPIWNVLDRIYVISGVFAAMFMVIILLLIVGQMVARWTNMIFPGGTEFAGYAMACTSFFAMAYALTRGSHIRVSIFLNMNDFMKFWLDALAMLLSAITATYFARYAVKTNYFSEMLNDRTQGLDRVPEWVLSIFTMMGQWPWDWADTWAKTSGKMVFTPVWLPQLAMSFGTILLAVALWDYLYRLLILGQTQIVREEVE
jgi:TRAP-type C4-dicarboxylate transport system permease small subunit